MTLDLKGQLSLFGDILDALSDSTSAMNVLKQEHFLAARSCDRTGPFKQSIVLPLSCRPLKSCALPLPILFWVACGQSSIPGVKFSGFIMPPHLICYPNSSCLILLWTSRARPKLLGKTLYRIIISGIIHCFINIKFS
jgi:hypothetical protein